MTQQELQAGAAAVGRVADRHGVGNWISEDQRREIAAEVIRAYLAAHSA